MPISPELRVRLSSDDYSKRLGKVQDALRVTILLNRLGQRLVSLIQLNFQTRSDSGGKAWAPLRPNTIASKRFKRYANPESPLLATGRLFSSMRYEVAGEATVRVFTDDPNARFHQYGTKGPYEIRPQGPYPLRFMTVNGMVRASMVTHPGLPARPFMPNALQLRNAAVRVVSDAVRQGLNFSEAPQSGEALSGGVAAISRTTGGRTMINFSGGAPLGRGRK